MKSAITHLLDYASSHKSKYSKQEAHSTMVAFLM